jgi:hypothetical protein
LPRDRVVEKLWQALDFLGQQPDRTLLDASRDELWQWARGAWRLAAIPRQRSIVWKA